MNLTIHAHAIRSFFFYIFTVILLVACGGGGGSSSPSAPAITLDSLSISPISTTLTVSETEQLIAIATYSDGSTADVTSQINWSVSDTSVASISISGLVTALAAGNSNIIGSYDGLSAQQSLSVKALEDLSITPDSLTLAIDTSQQLSVIGRYTDNSTENYRNLVTWSSLGSSIATASNAGVVTALDVGNVTLTASAEGVSTDLEVTVSPATLKSIVLSSPVTQLASGLSTPISAKGIYSDGSEQIISDQVVWSVSDISKAMIDSETGILEAIQAGNISVFATKGDIRGSYSLTISPALLSEIVIVPASMSLAKGSSGAISVTAIFSDKSKQDVSDQVVWSGNNSIASFDEVTPSTVMALSKGTSILTASLSGVHAELAINVTDAELVSLGVFPTNPSIPSGLNQQFTAQGTYTDGSVQDVTSQVTWLSENETVAVVSNADNVKGLVSSKTIGSSTITAVLGTIQQQTTLTVENAVLSSIDIQPANQTVAKGTDAEVKAYGYYSDGAKIDLSSQVIWNVSKLDVLDLSSIPQGFVHSLAEGTVLLSAEMDGISGMANIEVSSAILQSISIEALKTSLPNGMSQSLIARGTYSDASTKDITNQVTWQSDDASIFVVGNNTNTAGLVYATGVGQSIIRASLGGVTGQLSMDVTNAVLSDLQITTNKSQLNVKESAFASAVATYSDATTQDVTSQVNWLVNDVGIASIGNSDLNKGQINVLSVGSTSISASLNGTISNVLPINVSLNPNLPSALNLNVQPNIILNDNNDTSQVRLVLVPTESSGVIADGTEVELTIKEGENEWVEQLQTINGEVSYLLKSSYEGFISLSASLNNLSASSGLLSTDSFNNAIFAEGSARALYEDDTLRQGSQFIVLIRNLSNRVFGIEQIDIFYFDPNDGGARVNFPESPLHDSVSTSGGDLIGGEFTFIGYELDNDIEASIYGITYTFSDAGTASNFLLSAGFNFAQ